jgi:hypothetical protein
MQKIADHQDYMIPATIDDASIIFEITEALGETTPHQQARRTGEILKSVD